MRRGCTPFSGSSNPTSAGASALASASSPSIRNVPSDSTLAGMATPPSMMRSSTSPRSVTSSSIPFDIGQQAAQRLLYGLELARVDRFERVEKRDQILAHQPDVAHLLERIGSAHPLARLEVEEQPALQLAARRDQMGIVRRIMRLRENRVIEIEIVVGRMRLPFMAQMKAAAAVTLDERLALAGRLAAAVERSQVFVSEAEADLIRDRPVRSLRTGYHQRKRPGHVPACNLSSHRVPFKPGTRAVGGRWAGGKRGRTAAGGRPASMAQGVGRGEPCVRSQRGVA